MKNFSNIIFMVLALSFVACEISEPDDFFKDDDPLLGLTTLTVNASKSVVMQTTVVEFTVLDQNGSDVTSQANLYLDDIQVNSTAVEMLEPGVVEVYAEILDPSTQDISAISSEIEVEVIEPSYTTKMLIEDYTGAWCGWCPRMAQGIDDLADNPRIIPIAIHNGDSMEFRLEQLMATEFNVQGYPTGLLNRDAFWNRVSADAMDLDEPVAYLDKVVGAGLAINSTITGSRIDVEVSVGYDIDMSGTRLAVYALENGVLEDQLNYTNNYGGDYDILDFEHNHILKANLSELFGDVIPASDQERDDVFVKNYSYIATGVADVSGMEIVAMLVDEDGKVINVQKALAGTDKDFD